MTAARLLIFGLGYCGTAVSDLARGAGFVVTGTARQGAESGTVPFDAAAPAIAAATHVLSTVPPEVQGDAEASALGDPVLARYADAIAAAPRLRWIGYLSSTVVYGDRAGGWVDEDTPPAPSQQRGHRRLAAENAWRAFAGNRAVDLFRLAAIYGPGRSAFDTITSAQARRIVKPGHAFGRIHRDDIAAAVLAAMRQDRPAGRRILNLADDTPAESATVIEEAAELLGVPAPPAVAFADIASEMSSLARSFWAENRKVASRKTQAMLGLAWRYPSFREGLRAILSEEHGRKSLA
jgi:nucleoside-diphosphate-sugar epimerase